MEKPKETIIETVSMVIEEPTNNQDKTIINQEIPLVTEIVPPKTVIEPVETVITSPEMVIETDEEPKKTETITIKKGFFNMCMGVGIAAGLIVGYKMGVKRG
jgi:hypothetical protein